MKLSRDERDFLLRVRNGVKLRLASRAEDKIRQRLRKAGLVECVANPRRWIVTQAGINWLLYEDTE